MKQPKWETCTEEELWKFIATHLAKNDVDTILVGGAVASIYTKGLYRSGDLDFVVIKDLKNKLPKLMEEIGFINKGGRHYVHPKCKHIIVEFLSPPPAIGDDYNIVPQIIPNNKQRIRILTPTDCIKDRLASFIYFKAQECLDQALQVALLQPFDINKVKKWCNNEGSPKTFEIFKKALTKAQN